MDKAVGKDVHLMRLLLVSDVHDRIPASKVAASMHAVAAKMTQDELTGAITSEGGTLWFALEGPQDVIAKHFRLLRDHKNLKDHSLVSLRKINNRKFASVKITSPNVKSLPMIGAVAVQSEKNIALQ